MQADATGGGLLLETDVARDLVLAVHELA
jgi:hypothetical protein